MVGKVSMFKNGFGFITPDGGKSRRDVFFHFSEIRMEGYKSLQCGDEVEFDMGQTPEGKACAVGVTLIREVQS